MRPSASPDPALDPVESAQAVRGVGRLAPPQLRQVGVQQGAVVGVQAVGPDARAVGSLGERAAEDALDAGPVWIQMGAAVADLARDDELRDSAEHALETLGEIVALVRRLVQRGHVGDDAVEVDEPSSRRRCGKIRSQTQRSTPS